MKESGKKREERRERGRRKTVKRIRGKKGMRESGKVGNSRTKGQKDRDIQR